MYTCESWVKKCTLSYFIWGVNNFFSSVCYVTCIKCFCFFFTLNQRFTKCVGFFRVKNNDVGLAAIQWSISFRTSSQTMCQSSYPEWVVIKTRCILLPKNFPFDLQQSVFTTLATCYRVSTCDNTNFNRSNNLIRFKQLVVHYTLLIPPGSYGDFDVNADDSPGLTHDFLRF